MTDSEEKKDEKDQTETQRAADQAELAEQNGQVVVHNAKHLIHCLTVIGEVEDVVGSRMLYRVSDLDIVGLYLDEIRQRI